ncbi:Kunitz/Bovine pancreatic trypsin inhibitor domain protein [Oesophagostomum dentatum]|uniref:Kunitz/Bovine pancreatic trypsin inhibitor domain protein n=1 Tax=Oesophagostomum dentatum TaxID=61180 RepID=A0A0B1SPH4_OESDE|nr:Kunitz/Bovine pancreatic trypsin inhibitor domain protein [Oesophagostomum dentatum]
MSYVPHHGDSYGISKEHKRFGYDPTTKKCVKFTYGGCDGNENNFATRAECRETCKDYSNYDPTDVCKLPAERGPCMDNIPSYAYDSRTGKCVYFSYSGCGGNDNRFETKKECMKMCKPKSEEQDVCSLPVVAGPCTDAYTRYAYNSKKQKCVKFRFGGCEGNANNFETLEDCQSVCGGGTTKPTKPGQGT